MKDQHENDTDIQIALMPAPMDQPREELVRKLRVMAHETKARPQWWRYRLPASVATVAAVGAAVVLTTMMPAKASAKSFELIVAAAQRINAFQFSVLTDKEGKNEAFTIAGSDGHVYMRTGGKGIMQFDPGSMSIYDPDEKKVMRIKFGSLVDASMIADEVKSGVSEGMKEMDLKKMLAEYRAKYGEKGVRISPVTQEDGRSVYHVTLSSPDEPERVEMTVDASTDLPDTLEVSSKDGGNWHSSVKMEMKFGARVDGNLLQSAIPKDVKVEEIDLGGMVDGAMKGIGNLGDAFGKMGGDSKDKKSGQP